MSTIRWLLQTDSGVVGLMLRITLAVVFFPHGAQKVLGWFGGHGFKGTMKYFTDSGIPTVFALLAMAAEFLGSVGLVVGLLTRVAAWVDRECLTQILFIKGKSAETKRVHLSINKFREPDLRQASRRFLRSARDHGHQFVSPRVSLPAFARGCRR
jgi:hypothetical protein